MSIKVPNELIPSFLIFFAALTTSIYTFSLINYETLSARTIVSGVQEGQKKYVLSDSGKCIGTLESNLTSQNSIFIIHASGSLDVNIGQTKVRPTLDLQATFNSIGQLGGSLLRVSIDDSYFSVGSSGIDPMNLKLRSKVRNVEVQREVSVNGPVEMKKQRDGTYRIEYPELHRLKGYSDSMFGPAFSFISNLSLSSVDDIPAQCESSTRSSLDLTAQASFVSILGGQLSQFVDSRGK